MKWEWLQLLRPLQWTKNGLVLLPLIFSNNMAVPELTWRAFLMFAAFSAAASVIYIINDLVDVEQDRLHDTKRNRPLASGQVSRTEAMGLMILMILASLGISLALGTGPLLVILIYLAIQALYCFWWQRVVFLDVACIAAGFVLRTVAGGLAISVAISPWMLACAFLWAFFIAVNKRKSEIRKLGNGAAKHRQVLANYSPGILNLLIKASMGATIGAYSLYTVSGRHSLWMMVTIPLVAAGMLRYHYLVDKLGMGGSPERLAYQDRPLLGIVLGWLVMAAAIVVIYG